MQITRLDIQKRKLKKFYVILYVISKEIAVRQDGCIINKTVYVMYGIDINGNRQIVGVYFDNFVNNRYWLEKFEDIRARNLENILFFVTPKNKNIERCVKIVYNKVKVIHTPDTIVSQFKSFFPEKTTRKLQIDFKNIFFYENIEKYKSCMELFKEEFDNNKIILSLIEINQNEINKLYEYDEQIRRLFYPYYAIRELKREINKVKTLDELCTDINEVIEKMIEYLNTFERGRSYCKRDWLELINKVYEVDKEIMEEYING